MTICTRRFDRDGVEITPEDWMKLNWIMNYERVAFDEIETENVIIETKWTGIPDDGVGEVLDGIFVTLVKIPYTLFVHSFRGDGGYVIRRYASESEFSAKTCHKIAIDHVYRGLLNIPAEIEKWAEDAKMTLKGADEDAEV